MHAIESSAGRNIEGWYRFFCQDAKDIVRNGRQGRGVAQLADTKAKTFPPRGTDYLHLNAPHLYTEMSAVEAQAWRPRKLMIAHRYCTQTFADHSGAPALMVWKHIPEVIPAGADTPIRTPDLPPLFSFPIYFVHPAATHARIERVAAEFLDAIMDQQCLNGKIVRLDVYFLPGAREEDCVAHYHAEKSVRGLYTDQVGLLREHADDDDALSQSGLRDSCLAMVRQRI